jgi:hypothetical protein
VAARGDGHRTLWIVLPMTMDTLVAALLYLGWIRAKPILR